MRLTIKRILQALFLAILFSFSTLAMLRTFAASSTTVQQVEQEPRWMKTFVGLWPDRSLRSVLDEDNEDSINFDAALSTVTSTTTTTTVKPHTTLDDVFISVKTTKNFHATRLDVIIKTWFTLAREQVN